MVDQNAALSFNQSFDLFQAVSHHPCATNPNTPLLQFSDLPRDAWTLRDAYEGVQVFGATGSGKSSGVGRALAHAYLKAGMGGIVLCAKPDEAETWLRYAAETGRSNDIILFGPDHPHRFNFLEYEMRRDQTKADLAVSNVVDMLMTVMDVAARATSISAPAAGDKFWNQSTKMMLRQAVRLLHSTYGRVQLPEMIELLRTAPIMPAQVMDKEFMKNSFFGQTLRRFYENKDVAFTLSKGDRDRVFQFWTSAFVNMPEKTRGNVLATIDAELDPLLNGRMRDLFCTHSTIAPELTHDGKIIVLDMPILEYNEAAVMGQQIVKYTWQRATQKRKTHRDSRPVFMFGDECQYFISAYDMEFQSTARSSRAATVYMTQNLPLLYSKVGGNHAEHVINALIGNLRTKVFHLNQDEATNQWAARLVGKTSIWRDSVSQNRSWNSSFSENKGTSSGASYTTAGSGEGVSWSNSGNHGKTEGTSTSGGSSSSYGTSRTEHWDYAVEPEDFAKDLIDGGERHGLIVTGVIMQGGRTWRRNRKHWMKVAFSQV